MRESKTFARGGGKYKALLYLFLFQPSNTNLAYYTVKLVYLFLNECRVLNCIHPADMSPCLHTQKSRMCVVLVDSLMFVMRTEQTF